MLYSVASISGIAGQPYSVSESNSTHTSFNFCGRRNVALYIREASDPAERPGVDGAEGSPPDDRGLATTGGIIAQGASGEPARSTQLAAEAIAGVPWCRVPRALSPRAVL